MIRFLKTLNYYCMSSSKYSELLVQLHAAGTRKTVYFQKFLGIKFFKSRSMAGIWQTIKLEKLLH